MTYADVGDCIRDARKRAGMNQEELAELARLNRVTIAKYESGKVEPGAQALSRIADALDVSVDELLGRSIDQPAGTPRTTEARLLAAWADNVPEEQRKRAIKIMDTIFDMNAERFTKGTDSDET